MRSLSKIATVLVLVFCVFSLMAQDVEGDVDLGKELFKTNCAQCHNKNMKDDLTGPALADTEEHWADYPREDLHDWIRNSGKMIDQGHPRAVELWDEWSPVVMNSFPSLTDEDIESILAYINAVASGELDDDAGAAAEDLVLTQPGSENNFLFLMLAAVLFGLALVLARIISMLNSMASIKETGIEQPQKTFREILTSRGVIGFVTFAIIVLGGYTTVENAINTGRQQGYQPEQPIKFSHATHAGLNQIECQYCHDAARRSQHSMIPDAGTCMNCHTAIKTGSLYGTAELTKIFASVGYNPNTDTYIENYDRVSQKSIEKVYKEWIEKEYLKKEGIDKLDTKGKLEVDKQWDHIVESLTNDEKKKVQGPIEWTRIHNLPDHVYFNHSQHVVAGEIACQQCHGQIEEMEEVWQASPLSMGWCVNCHRESKVSGFSSKNNYYMHTYKNYVEKLENGTMQQVTVEDIGGIECQKCHY